MTNNSLCISTFDFQSALIMVNSSSSSEKTISPKLKKVEFSSTSGADPSRATLYLCMMLSASYSAGSVEVRWINEIE